MTDDETRARALLAKDYGRDHPAAGHQFTLSFTTTTHEHRVQELLAFAEAVRVDERERCARALETRDVYVAAAAFVRARGVSR